MSNSEGVKAFVYSCVECSNVDVVSKWSVRDGQTCTKCKAFSVVVGITNNESNTIMFDDMKQAEYFGALDIHEGLIKTVRKAKTIVSKQSMRDRLRNIDYKVSSLSGHLERIQAHVNSLSETIGKSESLLFTLLDTKQGAVKTIETLADTIKTQDRELVANYETFIKDKREMLDLLLERNNILLELNDEEK
jgi:hypothetical protein